MRKYEALLFYELMNLFNKASSPEIHNLKNCICNYYKHFDLFKREIPAFLIVLCALKTNMVSLRVTVLQETMNASRSCEVFVAGVDKKLMAYLEEFDINADASLSDS